METTNSLKKYKKKRNFQKSKEPKGAKAKKGKRPIFVIQKHDASSLHYDFRLEVDGVLKSWAIPKGPSTDPKEKRLAIPTEDHPMDYKNFEGVIPKGEYGAGTVLIWDRGTFRNLQTKKGSDEKKSMMACLREGHLTFFLNGKKIKGEYALIRTKGKGKKQWLLVKAKDDHADARRNPVHTENKSVKTGRTLKQIANKKKKKGP